MSIYGVTRPLWMFKTSALHHLDKSTRQNNNKYAYSMIYIRELQINQSSMFHKNIFKLSKQGRAYFLTEKRLSKFLWTDHPDLAKHVLRFRENDTPAVLCNDVSHWLGANLESALKCVNRLWNWFQGPVSLKLETQLLDVIIRQTFNTP